MQRSDSQDNARWWDRLDRILDEACTLPAREREAFLERACGDDPKLRTEATSLLEHSDSGEVDFSGIAASLGSSDGPVAIGGIEPDPYVGRRIHHYEIEARLGGGGMGIVYRALDTRLGRPVALKFIEPGRGADEAEKERLLVEAQAAAALDHPNVCTIHEVSETADGGLFIAMAYYEGETLKARLAREDPLPLDQAVDTIRQIAEGVRAAHARGIIHCDIKPANVLLTHAGVAKLLDFGIARHGELSLAGPDRICGTTAYMSPERFLGEPVDARSDIWSLAVVAYELLASRRPFHGDTPTSIRAAVLNSEPGSIADSRGDVPSALDEVIRRALAKDPAERQPSVAAFLRELDAALMGEGSGPMPAGHGLAMGRRRSEAWKRHRSKVLLGLAVALLGSTSVLFRAIDPAVAEEDVAAGAPSMPASSDADVVATAVAVLRFEDPDGAEQAWLADGIAEAIEAEIRNIEGVRVVGHFSSLTVDEPHPTEALFGTADGATYVLTGSVRRSADSVWVSPRLLEAASGAPVWAGEYGGPFTAEHLREMPRAVAKAAARTLALRFAGSPPAGQGNGLPDPATYERYLEGRYHLRRYQSGVSMTREGLDQSVANLRAVVAHSPNWAPGLAALGEALSWVGMFEADQGMLDAAFGEAGDVLELALRLDPNDARAHATLGYVLHRRDLDFTASEARFRRALELDPDQYWHCGYGFFLLWAGRYDEAAEAYRRAEVQDPLYLTLKDFLAASYLCSGRYDEAIATSEAVLGQIPFMAPVRRSLVLALQATGREGEAFAAIDRAPAPEHPYWQLMRALLHTRAGRTRDAEALLSGLDEAEVTTAVRAAFPSRQLSPAPLYAAVLVSLGRRAEAIEMLAAALERDPAVLLYDRCYPELRLLEDDARYRDLLRRSGVPTR